jgi:hypothetical protein
LEGQSTTTPETPFERGLKVQKLIGGAGQVDNMNKNSPENQKHV